eukprot:2373783-Amphidinium_carterae.1
MLSSGIDKCWEFDPTTVALADWMTQQPNSSPRQSLATVTETALLAQELNNDLGKRYSVAYEEAQLAVRIIDWLVSAQGCEHLRKENVASILRSPGALCTSAASSDRVYFPQRFCAHAYLAEDFGHL